jgi:hypothetical protein
MNIQFRFFLLSTLSLLSSPITFASNDFGFDQDQINRAIAASLESTQNRRNDPAQWSEEEQVAYLLYATAAENPALAAQVARDLDEDNRNMQEAIARSLANVNNNDQDDRDTQEAIARSLEEINNNKKEDNKGKEKEKEDEVTSMRGSSQNIALNKEEKKEDNNGKGKEELSKVILRDEDVRLVGEFIKEILKEFNNILMDMEEEEGYRPELGYTSAFAIVEFCRYDENNADPALIYLAHKRINELEEHAKSLGLFPSDEEIIEAAAKKYDMPEDVVRAAMKVIREGSRN